MAVAKGMRSVGNARPRHCAMLLYWLETEMPAKPHRSISRARSSVARRCPGCATRLRAGSCAAILGPLPHLRLCGGHDTRHDIGGAIEAARNARPNLVLPVVALVHRLVLRLALGFAFKPTQPDVDGIVGLATEAAANDHPFRGLEGNDLLLHDPDPLIHLAGQNLVLAEFVKGHVPCLLGVDAEPC